MLRPGTTLRLARSLRWDGRRCNRAVLGGERSSGGGVLMSSKNHERQRLERRFAMLLESAPDAILIMDPQGRIALANAEASRLFGYAREEFSGLSAEMLMPEQRRAAHVAHREA